MLRERRSRRRSQGTVCETLPFSVRSRCASVCDKIIGTVTLVLARRTAGRRIVIAQFARSEAWFGEWFASDASGSCGDRLSEMALRPTGVSLLT